jgi:hypothetical protein
MPWQKVGSARSLKATRSSRSATAAAAWSPFVSAPVNHNESPLLQEVSEVLPDVMQA